MHRVDPVMDLHIKLMTEAAEEALRGVRASEEFAARRLPDALPAMDSGLKTSEGVFGRLWKTIRTR